MIDDLISPELESLLTEFTRSGVRELHIRASGFELHLSNDSGARLSLSRPIGQSPSVEEREPRQVAPDPAPPPEAFPPEAGFIVRAPNLGTFYRAPKPGAPVYVEVGAAIERGDELCLIEVMKLFTAVRAEQGGRLERVLATDGEMVEAGQPLFLIAPAA